MNHPIDQRVFDAILRRNLATFIGKSFATVSPGVRYLPNRHIRAVAHQLERVMKGEVKRLLITMPPRYLKSTAASVAFPAFVLGQDPSSRIVCVSYAEDLSQKLARDCRAVMESGWYRRIFPGTRFSRTRSAELDFETTKRGGRLSTSVGGTLTGRGGRLIIIDDPQKPSDAMSAARRASTIDWFRNTLSSRLDDKRTDAIIVVMQRLHQDDLAGHLIEAGGWEHLCLPAIATTDVIVNIGNGQTYRRKPGDVLHEKREPLSVLMDLKATLGTFHFEAQYQQSPVPEQGNLIRSEWFRTYATPPSSEEPGRIIQSWDFAVRDGENNDFTVCITAHVWRNEVNILDVFRKKLDYPAQRRAVINLARQFDARVVLVELAANGSPLIADLCHLDEPGVPTPIGVKVTGSKVERLSVESHRIEAGDVMLPEKASWLEDFQSELLAFPLGRHDDQVDALSQLLQWIDIDQRDDIVAIGAPIIIQCE